MYIMLNHYVVHLKLIYQLYFGKKRKLKKKPQTY